MPRRNRYLIALLLLIPVSALFGYLWRDAPSAPPTLPAHSYAKALRQAHDGQPGAARVLYQQLQRTDLPAIRRAALYAELPNYPSPQALKLARQDWSMPTRWCAVLPLPVSVACCRQRSAAWYSARCWTTTSKAYALPR